MVAASEPRDVSPSDPPEGCFSVRFGATVALDLWRASSVVLTGDELRASVMDLERFAETEGALAVTDRLWRTEMRRVFGPDAVLLHGYGAERQGAPGTRLRTTFEARRSAIAAWRHVRRPAA